MKLLENCERRSGASNRVLGQSLWLLCEGLETRAQVVRFLQWSKLRHWPQGCPRCQHGGMKQLPRGGLYMGAGLQTALSRSIWKRLRWHVEGPRLHPGTPWSRPPWILEPTQLRWEPLWRFLWPGPTEGPIPGRHDGHATWAQAPISTALAHLNQSFSALKKSFGPYPVAGSIPDRGTYGR